MKRWMLWATGALALLLLWALRGSVGSLHGAHETASAATAASDRPAGAPQTSGRRPQARDHGRAMEAEVSLGGAITGKDGAPLAGATVCAVCWACDSTLDGNRPVCAKSNAEGRYHLRGLPKGTYRLSVGGPGYATTVVGGGDAISIGEEGLSASDLDATLEEEGVVLSGFVADATGGPVANATVQVNSMYTPWEVVSQVASSDEEGFFSLSVSPGPVRVLAIAEGYAPANVARYAPAMDVRLVLAPSASITGHVVTAEQGQPVPGIRVHARARALPSEGTYARAEAMAVSDANGEFRLEGLRPGVYALEAQGDGFRGRPEDSVVVDLLQALSGVTIPVDTAYTVSGTAYQDGEPCRLGLVVLRPVALGSAPPLRAQTQPDGTVALRAVPPGTYRTAFKCDDYDLAEGPMVTVDAADVSGIEWRAMPGLDLAVEALGPGGQPVPHLGVTIERVDDAPSFAGPGLAVAPGPPGAIPFGRTAQTDDKGTLVFRRLPEGQYALRARDLETPVTVEVSATSTPNTAVLILNPVGHLEIIVTTPSGEPNDEVAVSAAPTDGGPLGAPGRARGGGHYRVGPLAVGPYVVEVRDGVSPRVTVGEEAPIEVRSGETTTVEVTYGGYDGVIRGRVLAGPDRPLANVWVRAEPADAASDGYGQALQRTTQATARRVLTDAYGAFELTELDPEGTYTVSATRPLGARAQRQNVRVGQEVEIVLEEPAVLGGIAVASDGTAVSELQVSVTNAGTGQTLLAQFTDPRGRWMFDNVAPGQVRIEGVAANGAARGELAREVRAGQAVDDVTLVLQVSGAMPPNR